MGRTKLDAEYVRSLFIYEPDTGRFFHRSIRPGLRASNGLETARPRKHGYRVVYVDGIAYTASHIAWLYVTGQYPEKLIDHKDGDKTNDRFENLRACDHFGNNANVRMHDRNKVGKKGVIKLRDTARSKPFRAQIRHGGKNIIIGFYKTADEAHAAYVKKAIELKGEFARAA